MGKDWSELTPEEKRAERFKRWLSPPDVTFDSPEAEQAYKGRVGRIIKAINLEEADRVPVMLPSGFFPAYYAGGNLKEVMYDYDRLRAAWEKYLADFDGDTYDGPGLVMPAKALEIMGYQLFKWPGNGLPDNATLYQYVEGEYMTADEYDAFITDPSDFLWRTFLPRTSAAFEGFRNLPHMTPMVAVPLSYVTGLNRPGVRQAFQSMLDAAAEVEKWQNIVGPLSRRAIAAGFTTLRGGMSQAPFDMIGDMMRGTQGIMLDMYRRPEKLKEAMERVTPITIEAAVANADKSLCPVVMMPLHKGDDTFMSARQYEEFYWPTFRRVMLGLIEEGLVPMPFAEGKYGARLEIVRDMPRGSVIWWFDQTDMAKAKMILGDNACIAGNVPTSLLCTSTPQSVKDCCRKLIEDCGPGGGFILSGGAGMDKGDPNNLHVMMEAAMEYGVYG